MEKITHSIEVNVAIWVAYNQWTQFEEFPNFMEGVKQVNQIDDAHLHWESEVAGKDFEWDAEIYEQIPNKLIAWRSIRGEETNGVVQFEELGPAMTRIHLEVEYNPDTLLEHIGDKLGFMTRRIQGDLERFKDFIEARGIETGAWRGEIIHP